jgi:hypothetical protein
MTENIPEKEDEADAERRFNETVGNLLRTPHKPHTGGEKLDGNGRKPKLAPKPR